MRGYSRDQEDRANRVDAVPLPASEACHVQHAVDLRRSVEAPSSGPGCEEDPLQRSHDVVGEEEVAAGSERCDGLAEPSVLVGPVVKGDRGKH